MSSTVPRLLLVEDEEAHAELVRRAFEDQAEVAVASSLVKARDLLETDERPFDLVLTDLRLPDGLGTSLLDAEAAKVPIVIMTSQGDERAAVEAIKRGAYDYVVKSVVAFEEMPRTAERVLREWRHAKEKEELRQALAERERLAGIGTAAAMLAHEIGNPLNSMSLATKVIERRLAKLGVDVSSVTEVLTMCQRELGRLATLLAEFQQLSRQRNLELEPLDVASLFSTVCDSQGPAFEESSVEVEIDLPADPLLVLANRDKMTQVIVNLCKNAIEAMPTGGSVRLSAEPGEDTVTLTVTDSGPGLPEDIDVFAPFTSTKEKGTGLGLAIVAQILAAHGGLASHERPEEGGACFRLQLRRAPLDPH
jgi:two-component system sensor histidine kinase HydH